jgi:hypothetical protein
VSVLASGSSSVVVDRTTAGWTVGTPLVDGPYFWQARATDTAGNQSSWTATRGFTLDTVPPGAPGGIAGVVAHGRLTIRWSPPNDDTADDVAGYVLYVNGVRSLLLDGGSSAVNLGKFTADDGRTFAVAAVDRAGNESPLTATLVGVPDLIGLKIPEAAAALAARGLVVGDQSKAVARAGSVIVVAQMPSAPTLAVVGSPVAFVVADQATPRAGATLLIQATLIGVTRDHDFPCVPNGRLSLTLKLSAAAKVTVRFLTARGGPLASRQLGSLRAGTTRLKLKLPPSVHGPGVYRMVVTATTKTQVASTEMHLSLPQSRSKPLDRSAACRRQ